MTQAAIPFRYVAKRTLVRGRHECDDLGHTPCEQQGERMYFQVGDEIPPEQFASGGALQAAIHRDLIAQVPTLPPAENPSTALEQPLQDRIAELEAEVRRLKAAQEKPATQQGRR